MARERFIKTLGEGSASKADLVMHPEHGLVVRKSVLQPTTIPVKDIAKHPSINIYDRIRQYQGAYGPSNFAKVHSVDPDTGLIFQEYLPHKTLHQEVSAQFPNEQVETVRSELASLAKKLRTAKTPQELAELEAQRSSKAQYVRKADRTWQKALSIPMPYKLQDMMAALEAGYGLPRSTEHLLKNSPELKKAWDPILRTKRREASLWDYDEARNVMRTPDRGIVSFDASQGPSAS
jgi:hypothetical protein